jgi:hypothetical protein
MLATHGTEAAPIPTNAAVAMMRLAVSAGRKAVEQILDKAQQSEAREDRRFERGETPTEPRNDNGHPAPIGKTETTRSENSAPARISVDVRV